METINKGDIITKIVPQGFEHLIENPNSTYIVKSIDGAKLLCDELPTEHSSLELETNVTLYMNDVQKTS